MVSNNIWTKIRRTLISRRKWRHSRLRHQHSEGQGQESAGAGGAVMVRSGRSGGSPQSEARSWRLVNLSV